MSRKFTDFVSEASRREQKSGIKRKPYIIELEDSKQITVPAPDANTIMMLSKASGNPVDEFRILFRNNPTGYNRLVDALEGQPPAVIGIIIEDMMAFWGNDIDMVPGK